MATRFRVPVQRAAVRPVALEADGAVAVFPSTTATRRDAAADTAPALVIGEGPDEVDDPVIAWCESCGRRPAVLEVVVPVEAERDSTRAARARLTTTARPWRRVEVDEVFRVCADCAPTEAAGPADPKGRSDRPRVTVTSTDPAAGYEPTDVRWGGVIRIRRTWPELLWPFGFLLTPPVAAIDAWLLTGNVFWVLGTTAAAMVTLIAVDHFRDNPDT